MSGLMKFVAVVGLALSSGAVTAYADSPALMKTLSAQQLGEMLNAMGLNAQPLKNDFGVVVGFESKLRVGNWSLPLVIAISPNGRTVEFSINLTKIVDPHAVPTETMQRLMKLNNQFLFVKYHVNRFDVVAMTATISADLATPASLKAQLDWLQELLEKSETLWNPQALGQPVS